MGRYVTIHYKMTLYSHSPVFPKPDATTVSPTKSSWISDLDGRAIEAIVSRIIKN